MLWFDDEKRQHTTLALGDESLQRCGLMMKRDNIQLSKITQPSEKVVV